MGNGNENGTSGVGGLNSEPAHPYRKMTFMSRHPASEIGGVYDQFASAISFKSTTGTVGASGKLLFTATQWQELERQTVIYKYIMASIPVPPQLLIPLSTRSNRSMGLKFSNGSDPEPWRCKRTDGKKWRCSKDVAPDQKYCERHAHKSRPRSRKPVEAQSQNTKDPLPPSADINNPTMLSTAAMSKSDQQVRSTGWFMKNGTESRNQFQQPMQTPGSGSKKDQVLTQHKSYLDHNNPYLNTTSTSTTTIASGAAAGTRRQHFIDAWSRIGSGDDCSLTLSTQSGGNGIKFEDHEMAVGMLDADRGGCGDVFRSHHQWLNHSSWAGSTPGGPLGEALCLGIASTTNLPPNVPSPHGYSNSTTRSSSCEGGDGHGHGQVN